eukprot:3940682-Rhodomonas_salina.3
MQLDITVQYRSRQWHAAGPANLNVSWSLLPVESVHPVTHLQRLWMDVHGSEGASFFTRAAAFVQTRSRMTRHTGLPGDSS